jgi:hypothetical protein
MGSEELVFPYRDVCSLVITGALTALSEVNRVRSFFIQFTPVLLVNLMKMIMKMAHKYPFKGQDPAIQQI